MSRAQIKFLRGVIEPAVAAHFPGAEPADIHEWALITCFGGRIVEIFGKKRMKPLRRTSTLTTTELTDLIDTITKQCREHGIELPTENHE